MSDSSGSAGAFIGRVEVSAFSRATEIMERVETAILNLFPESLRERVKISRTSAEGHLKVPLVIVSAVMENKSRCKSMFSWLLSSITKSDRRHLLQSIEKRLSEDCVFFLRIDKQAAYLGNLQLAQVHDVISVKIHFRNFPRCKFSEAEELATICIKAAGEDE